MITQWLVTFVVTLTVEVAVAYPILGLVEKRSSRRRRRLALIAFANLLTHPLVFGIATIATSITKSAPVVIVLVFALEIGASVLEALVYRFAVRVSPIAIAASFLANAASVLVCFVFWA